MKTQPKLSEYDQQALDFLKDTGTNLDVVYIYTGPYFDDEEEPRDVYQFTLKNERGIYSAKFGDSINNTQRRLLVSGKVPGHRMQSHTALMPADERLAKKLGFKVSRHGRLDAKEIKAAREHKPGAYDILACLSVYGPMSFKSFCSEFGYSDDSIKAQKVYNAVSEQEEGLSRIFTPEQIEQLNEIN